MGQGNALQDPRTLQHSNKHFLLFFHVLIFKFFLPWSVLAPHVTVLKICSVSSSCLDAFPGIPQELLTRGVGVSISMVRVMVNSLLFSHPGLSHKANGINQQRKRWLLPSPLLWLSVKLLTQLCDVC